LTQLPELNMTTENSTTTPESDSGPKQVSADNTQFVTFATLLQVTLFSIIVTLAGVYVSLKVDVFQLLKQDTPAVKVVYLDIKKLMDAGIKKTLTDTSNSDKTDFTSDAEVFQKRIASEMKRYSDAGYLIVNKNAVLNNYPIADVTQVVIENVTK